MTAQLNLLVVDDEKDFRELLRIILLKQGYLADTAANGEEALRLLGEKPYDILLTDMMMSGMGGRELVGLARERHPGLECIVITGYGSIETAVETIKQGAFSYIIKSSDPQELLIEIQKIAKIKTLSEENERLRHAMDTPEAQLKTASPVFAEAVRYAEKAAATTANILILGESGVGKEVLARYIHQKSPRSANVFMAVNCHSLSDTLLESELYGHEKGAFTGSQTRRIGRFEAADSGTLFLDEVGDMPLTTQVKILRNIENREIERIGSNLPVKVDFRLICATNKSLGKEIRNGRFREDLYYRINTVVIDLPPLRERREDLPMLVEFFAARAAAELKKDRFTIAPDLMERLLTHGYPGNIRELKNIIERLAVLADGEVLTLRGARRGDVFNAGMEAHAGGESLREVRRAAERNHILRILAENDHCIDKSAAILEISSRQLYNKLKEYEIPLT